MKYNLQSAKLLLFILPVALLMQGCVGSLVRKGNEHFDKLSYAKAANFYEKALGKKDIPEAQIKLAESYRLMNNTQKAEEAYSKVVKLEECEPVHRYYYVRSVMNNKKYDKAEELLKAYKKGDPKSTKWRYLEAACDSLETFRQDSMFYTIEKLPPEINSAESNFSTTYMGKGLLFASERDKKALGMEAGWTGAAYLDLFYTRETEDGKWSTPERLEGKINGPYHEGPAVFTKDMSKIYFTRSNFHKGKRGKSDELVNNLQLFTADRIEGKWKNIQPLPFNDDEYSVGHPAWSPDGDILYFISDQPGGYGGTDLYHAHFIEGNWTEPENLGPTINTPGNEMFPFYHSNGTLYFSSDGSAGLGGLDVFYATAEGHDWSEPINLKYPVNSAKDDFGFILNDELNAGYFSSNRDNEGQRDEIFHFVRNNPVYSLRGLVLNQKTKEPLPNALVKLENPETGESMSALADDAGKFDFPLAANSDYGLNFSKQDFFTKTRELTTKGERWSRDYTMTVELEPMVIGKPIVLQNIYYDYDKWDLRPESMEELDRLVKVLEDNPGITTELSSHTDSRGSDKYNEVLSQKRAKSAVDYILSKGIPADRIKAKGYGEFKLVNNCEDGVDCSEEAHQLNRRTEFTVIGLK